MEPLKAESWVARRALSCPERLDTMQVAPSFGRLSPSKILSAFLKSKFSIAPLFFLSTLPWDF